MANYFFCMKGEVKYLSALCKKEHNDFKCKGYEHKRKKYIPKVHKKYIKPLISPMKTKANYMLQFRIKISMFVMFQP